MHAVAGLELAQRLRAGPDRIDQEGKLAWRSETERQRARQHPARSFEHEELSRRAWVDLTTLKPQQRVEADALTTRDRQQGAPRRHPRAPWRSDPAERQR